MFESIETLESDLIRFANAGFVLPLPFRLVSSDVGKAVIQLAGGKTPKSLSHLASSDGSARADMQKSASRFVADILLSPVCNHFTTLGVAPDFEASALRDNFRRLMALVHPDARPVGFPEDAASRVNRAYAILADADTRETYAALESGRTSVRTSAAVSTAPRNEGRARSAGKKPEKHRFLGWASALRARQSLLWLAAILLVPLGMGVMSLFSSKEPQRLVEARPRLSQSFAIQKLDTSHGDATAASEAQPTTALSVERSVAIELASVDAKRIPIKGSAPERKSSPSEVAASIGQPHPIMTPQLSSKSIEISSKRSMNQSSSLAPSAPIVPVDSRSPGTAPPENIAMPRAVEVSTQLLAQSPQQATAIQPPSTGAVVATSPASPQRNAAITERTESAQRVKSTDADEVVVRFSNAYESGSIAAFGQLLAPGMAGRRQMLNEYERVFQATRQRSIKFKQLKHAANGERISTSGYATVTTIDQDNRTIVQRVFLEFDIGRERGEPRIERLANYVIN